MKKKNENEATNARKGKKTRDVGQTKSGGRRKTGSGVAPFVVSALSGTGIVIVILCLLLAWLQFGRHQALSETRLAQTLVQSQTSLLEMSLRDANQTLQRIAESQWVRRAVTEDRAGEAARQISSVTQGRVYIFRQDASLAETDLSFTARDLIQKVRDKQQPQPVLLPGNPPRLLNARAIGDGEGVVLLDARLDQLKQQLAGQNLQNANVEIRQEGGATLLDRGNTNRDGVAASAQAPFNVAVELRLPSSARDPALLMLFGLISLGGLLVALVLEAFVFRTLAKAIRKDGAILSNLAQELARDGNALPRGTFSFEPLQLVTGNVQRLAQKAQQSTRRGAATGPGRASSASAQRAAGMMVDEGSAEAPSGGETAEGGGTELPAALFRAYDIRGRTDGELTEAAMRLIGQAIGSEAADQGQADLLVARDGRSSSPALEAALIEGITSSGVNAIKLGAVPTPLLYHAVSTMDTRSGVCVTGSHNPAGYNGLKIVLNGESLHGEQITRLRDRIARNDLKQGEGRTTETEITQHYLDAIQDDIVLARPLHVVVDCANGIAGTVAPAMLEGLGCDVSPLYTEVDGSFPNHGPDPGQPENLKALIDKVSETGADLGLAFDGDGDRLTVVTASGEIIWPDRLMMLYARDLLSRSPGADIIFDVKSSRELPRLISQQGGRPLMWKTGHSLLHAKLRETGAPLAGEMSGHVFFADRWNGFDDALYAAARMLEILSLESDDAQKIFDQLTTGPTTPEIRIPVTDERKFTLMEQLVAAAGDTDEGSVSTLDGLRIDFEDGWGLIRASNTEPALTARFEGRDQAALERIQQFFRERLQAADNSLELPF